MGLVTSPQQNGSLLFKLETKSFFFSGTILDDHSVPWKWNGLSFPITAKCEGDLKSISTYILLDFWQKEAKFQGLDHYHFIGNSFLDVEDIQTVAREIW